MRLLWPNTMAEYQGLRMLTIDACDARRCNKFRHAYKTPLVRQFVTVNGRKMARYYPLIA